MEFIQIYLDLSRVDTLEQLHILLKKKLGFPDFYRNNIHSLVDCLSSIRFPDEGMSSVFLSDKDDVLILNISGLMTKKKQVIINDLLIAVEIVNFRETFKERKPSIYLALVANIDESM